VSWLIAVKEEETREAEVEVVQQKTAGMAQLEEMISSMDFE
jgi:hypothetical protein